MRIRVKEANLHRLFEITLVFKALHSLLEIISGALFATLSTDAVFRIAKFVTQGEILEDPNDLIANYLLRVARELSIGSKAAAAFFLLSHGTVKLALVLAVMRGWAWAYPAFMIGLGLLIGYQSYQLWRVFSVGLTLLTIVDVLVLVLTWHEYGVFRRRHRRP